MKPIFKLMAAYTITAAIAIFVLSGCKKADDPAEEAYVYSNSKQHKAACIRQDVTGCAALETEMTGDGKNPMCGLLPIAFPATCIPSPTYTATICVDRVTANAGTCATDVFTVPEQNALFATTNTVVNNYLTAVCGASYSWVFTSYSVVSGSNGCATAHPWLKVTFKYKCCS